MTAPARAGGAARTRTRTQPLTGDRATTGAPAKTSRAATPDSAERGERSAVTHSRTASAERAYARRTGRGSAGQPTKPERKAGSASRVSFVILVMGLLVVGVVATLWLSTQSTADSYQLAQIQQNTQNLAARVQQLQQEIAQARSPGQLAKLAQQLGMVPANNLAHLVVGPNGAVTVVGTPSAATSSAPPPPPSSTDAPPPDTDSPNSDSTAPSTQSTAGG